MTKLYGIIIRLQKETSKDEEGQVLPFNYGVLTVPKGDPSYEEDAAKVAAFKSVEEVTEVLGILKEGFIKQLGLIRGTLSFITLLKEIDLIEFIDDYTIFEKLRVVEKEGVSSMIATPVYPGIGFIPLQDGIEAYISKPASKEVTTVPETPTREHDEHPNNKKSD